MCEKSRSYASSTARDMASFADMQNAGGSCKSWNRIKGQKQKIVKILYGLASTTAPRYPSDAIDCNALLIEAVVVIMVTFGDQSNGCHNSQV